MVTCSHNIYHLDTRAQSSNTGEVLCELLLYHWIVKLLKDSGDRTSYYHLEIIANFQYFGMEWDICSDNIYQLETRAQSSNTGEVLCEVCFIIGLWNFSFWKKITITHFKLAMIRIIGNTPALQKRCKYETCIFTVSQLCTFPWSVMDWLSEELFDTLIRSEIMAKTVTITLIWYEWLNII